MIPKSISSRMRRAILRITLESSTTRHVLISVFSQLGHYGGDSNSTSWDLPAARAGKRLCHRHNQRSDAGDVTQNGSTEFLPCPR
jgi:hypothetical protein